MKVEPNAFRKFIYRFLILPRVIAFFALRIGESLLPCWSQRNSMKCIFSLLLFLFTLACAPVQEPSAVPTASDALDADIEMESAFQEAQNTLDVFIERIATPHPNRTYVAVKVRFSPPDGPLQDIWVDNVTYLDGAFHGNMGDDIPSLKLSFGEEIVIPTEDIVDWMIVEDGKLIGGYTIRFAYERMSPEEKERFLEAIDYSIED